MSFEDVSQGTYWKQQRQESAAGDRLGGSSSNNYDRSAAVVRSNIGTISSNVGTIRRLTAALGTEKDSPELRQRLHGCISENKSLSQETKSLLRQLGSMMSKSSYQGTGQHVQRLEQRKLGDDLQKTVKAFQDAVKEALQKERACVAVASTQPDENTSLLGYERGQEMVIADNDLEYNEAMIAERSQGIKDVEKSVREVNEIFKDLSVIVADQGHMIDDIESSVVDAMDRTKQGTAELNRAAANQRKARKTMCCLILVLTIIVALIVYSLVAN